MLTRDRYPKSATRKPLKVGVDLKIEVRLEMHPHLVVRIRSLHPILL